MVESAHFFDGNKHYTLPSGMVGTCAPLTAIPYTLSICYVQLVDDPLANETTIKEKLAQLHEDLPRLGSHDLRQAKADIVYLKAILDGQSPEIAQDMAGTVWSMKEI